MIWTLDLKPSQWGESLILPRKYATPSTFLLSNDPASLGDLLEDVLYLVQTTPHTYDFVTQKPAKLNEWMRGGDASRLQLLARLSQIRWGVIMGNELDRAMVYSVIAWPVKSRVVVAPREVNLSEYEPHEFSTVGHSGRCEDCNMGRGENLYHYPGTPQLYERQYA